MLEWPLIASVGFYLAASDQKKKFILQSKKCTYKMTQFLHILLIYILCGGSTFVLMANIPDTDTAETTLNFVNNAQSKLTPMKNANIILVIGTTGCGKSTLVHYLACDYSRIESIDDGISTDFIVRDGLDQDVNNAVHSTVSRTLLPQIYVDDDKNVFVDNPGFEDTRNQTVEIATTFLIKSIIESASTIKIVLIADYGSVTNSYSRNAFDNLLSRTTQLIKNIQRFENSVSLVVSKAPSFKVRGRFVLDILDANVKNTTVEFIRSYRAVLPKNKESENKIQLIDSLLKQSPDGDFSKISIFWRPNGVGPFNTIDKMIAGRRKIRDSILHQTSFAQMHRSDFGFPLSAAAQIKVQALAQHTIDDILMTVTNVSDSLFNEIQQQINTADKFATRLALIELGNKCFELNAHTKPTLTLNQFAEQLKTSIRAYSISSIDMMQFRQIERHEHNLNILNSLIETSKAPASVDLNSTFVKLRDFFTDFEGQTQSDIEKTARQLNENITIDLTNIDNKVFTAIQNRLRSVNGFQIKLELLKIGTNCSRSAREEITLQQRMDQLKNMASAFNVTSIDQNELNHIAKLHEELQQLKSIAKAEIVVPVRDWIASSSRAIDYKCSEYDWYAFLDQTYTFFGSYEVQMNVAAYNVADLDDWKQLNKPQGLLIDDNNFNEFTKRILSNSEFVSPPSRIEELNEIVNVTLKSPPQYECSDQTMTIKGIFVMSSDIRLSQCPSIVVEKINVFVIDTFFVDSDLSFNEVEGIELHILAYTWNILKVATFNLNGVNGEFQAPPDSSGTAGRPGNIGTNAGHFFGLANRIFNGDLLTVQTAGGDGGDGQDGTGNQDVEVKFRTTYNTKTYGDTNVESYLRNFIHAESGVNHVETLSIEMTDKGGAGVWGATDYKFKFRLFSNRCCGRTGLGGPGKERNHLCIKKYIFSNLIK